MDENNMKSNAESKKDLVTENGIATSSERRIDGFALKDASTIGRKDILPERKYSFEMPPPPIPENQIKKTLRADVVVVGAGLAGVSAAISAAEAGAKVVVVEKASSCQARGGHHGFIGSRLQKKLGIKIDGNEVVLNLMKSCANKPDQRLLRMWAEGGAETADWILDMTDTAGIEVTIPLFPPPTGFNNADEYYPHYHTNHAIPSKTLINCLEGNALRKGVTFLFQNRAQQLLKKDNERVTGIIVREADGDYIKINAEKAVILCTGDYGNNAEMMDKYCPQAAYLPAVVSTSTGDGHQMAMWIGAVMEPAPHAPMSHGSAGPVGSGAFLQVNLKGERFQNEDISCQAYTNAVERQPGRQAWQVFDSKYQDDLQYMGIGLSKIMRVTEAQRQIVEKQSVSADTFELLAQKMRVPAATFQATVARYNELATLGKDLDFGKRADRLRPLNTPPYYAGKGRFGLLAVMGGLNLNPQLQALDKNMEVIPGLYLAGNTMGNRFAVDYPTMAPGISHGMALHYGRIAGQNAIKLA
jgi:fumarate reductase flavoprotein subunit